MDHAIEAELSAAAARGKALAETEPRATAARYDRASRRVVIDLINGCSYIFPAQMVEDLASANDADLEAVEVTGLGFNLYWPALEADLHVPALVSGLFGTKAWMTRELARRAGQAKTPAKTAAVRANGLKGGRPRKAG